MQQRLSFVTTRPVAILMMFLAAVVFGWLSLGRLPVTLMPELTYPTLTVRTEYPGAAPEEVENDIGRPIEEALGIVSGLRKISSINRAGVSDVILEFAWDAEMDSATQDVLEKLDRVFLPTEAERPLILHYDPSLDPIMELSLSGKGERFDGESGLRRLRRVAELQLKRELEPVKGIAAVRVRGGLEEEIHVQLDASALARTGISIQQVINRLRDENINLAGGTLKEGRIEYLVRTLNEYDDIAQIGETIVATYESRPVRIRDLGRVEYSQKEREILTRSDGGDSVQIDIFKEADANIVDVAGRITAMVGRFTPPDAGDRADAGKDDAQQGQDKTAETQPAAAGGSGGPRNAGPTGLAERLFKDEGARLDIVADRSVFIESSINEVKNTAMLGGLLAILVLYLFLRNVKSTAIIAVSIPISLLITFAPMNLWGVSMNIMSLGGLALGIGMLVDSSIVVLESIYRCREEGDDIAQAADRGTSEVRSAVAASTLTSIAVFFPMVFVEGIAGQAFGNLGLAVVISLLASLAVALFFIPMLASRKGLGFEPYTFAYFHSPGWAALRDRYTPLHSGLRVVLAPLFALAFAGSFHSYYLKLAVADLRSGVTAAPRWFKFTNFHNWLIQGVLLLPLPYVVRGLQHVEKHHLALIRRIWSELRQDFANTAPLVRWLTFPFWLVRGVLSLALPHALLPWPWPYLFVSRSWGVVRADFQRIRSPKVKVASIVSVVPLAYWILRTVLGAVVEGLGRVLMWTFSFIVAAISRVLFPIFGLVFGGLLWIPAVISDAGLRLMNRTYPRVLRSALAHPGVVIVIVAATVWGSWLVATSMDSELLPEVYQGEFTVEVALPVGTPLEETDAIVAPIEQAILEDKANIRSLIMTAGFDSANSQRSDEGEHTAKFKILLDERSRGAEMEQQVIARLRQRFEHIPDLEARIVRPVLFSSKTPIEVEVQGTDLRLLRQYGDQVRDLMAAMPELTDVESALRPGAPEVQIIYDRDRLSRYELTIGDVARQVRDKVKGFEATKFNLKDRRIPILVRLAVDDRETVEDVKGIIVNPGGDRAIPLSAVADVSLGEGPSEVRRIGGSRVALVRANLAEGSLSVAAAEIERTLKSQIDWPIGMSFSLSGQNEEWENSRSSLILALGLSLFLVYVIMAAQFESLIHPLVIMLTIPLAFIGTLVTLKLLGMNLSIVVFLGMIMLAGIVVNNAIVLVDYINTLRARDMPRDEAIIKAGEVRLRPILMTTATTVLGLLPLALGLGDGAEIRAPMAIAVISGLISSTVLTLVVIPSVYAMLDSLASMLAGSRVRVAQGSRATLDEVDPDSVMT